MTEISPYYQRSLTCFACHGDFKTTKIRSRFIRFHQHDTDFCPNYLTEDLNPLFYNVNVCPHCGFSFTDSFSKSMSPVLRNEIHKHITAHWSGQSYGELRTSEEGIKTYKLAILSAGVKREKPIVKAGLYLRTAWLYRSMEEQEQECRFLSLAVEAYCVSYSQEDLLDTQMSTARILYLIAELYYRLGKYPQSALYFSKVIQQQKLTKEPRIIEMARNRWEDLRENYKKAK
ncbi:DUF2225 domain-containing protein [Bacillus sp. SCS-153A]|uniref:DUF2225 domain-containing protein n=1 Tax=Rossellomorea sedimentorum TaxID=3115294 RepID=UPI00390671C4